MMNILRHQYMGAEVWVWLVTLVALPILNDLVQRSRSVLANSLIQAVGNALRASKLYAIPLLKQIADVMATPRNVARLSDTAGEINLKGEQ